MAGRIVTRDGYTWCIAPGSKLKRLTPLLNQWIKLIKEYCRAHECEDNPWWYNERANISLLAGAAWRLKKEWLALEEYPADKRRTRSGKPKKMAPVVPKKGIEGENKPNRKGRVDLYVANGDEGYAIEAKQLWQKLSPGSANRLGTAMKMARDAAGALYPWEAEYRVGAVFIIPYIPVEQVREDLANGKKGKIEAKLAARILRDWIAEAKLDTYSGYAYIYTNHCQGYVSDKGDRVFPGVILVLKNVTKSPPIERKH